MSHIRKMQETDLAECAQILEDAYGLPPYNEKFPSGTSLAYIKSKYAYCAEHSFILEDEDNIVGFIISSLSVWVEGGQAIIEEIVVSPSHQGKGYGKALIVHTEKYLKDIDIHSVILWGRRDAPAHGFHKSNGFEDSDEWVIMSKELS